MTRLDRNIGRTKIKFFITISPGSEEYGTTAADSNIAWKTGCPEAARLIEPGTREFGMTQGGRGKPVIRKNRCDLISYLQTMRRIFFFLLAVLSVIPGPVTASVNDGVPEDWLTVAEKSSFGITASHAQTMEFLSRLANTSDLIQLSRFGRSGLGRSLPLIIASADGFFTPEAAHAAGVPIILIQSCIHPGEVAGKTASLMLLRDIILGREPELLKAGVILFAPIYNADGHEDVSTTNRANQHGPEGGMGFRTTAVGLDLNRDHLKLDSVEAQALVELINRWQPQLHVDNHVTNGSHHHWLLTYSRAEAPQLAPSLDQWLDLHLPAVFETLNKQGIPTGPYVSLIDGSDPAQGIDSSVAGPRYSTGYFTIRNRISILVEMYAYAPFEERVRANKMMLEELLREISEEPGELVRAVKQAAACTTALGRPEAAPSDIVLRWKTSSGGDTIKFPVCRWTLNTSLVTGHPMLSYSCSPDDPPIIVPWKHRPEAELKIKRPRGYIVMPAWHQALQRLRAHGLVLKKINSDLKMNVETIRLGQPHFASGSYQGRVRVESFETTRQTEERSLPEGAFWIPADQPDFEVAVQLLEPEAPDSLLRWGYLDSVFERKEYIGLDKLEDLVHELLRNPETEEAWKKALEDSEFASDGGARYLWWYRRTPYWDESVGLMPVYRIMKAFDIPTMKEAGKHAPDIP